MSTSAVYLAFLKLLFYCVMRLKSFKVKRDLLAAIYLKRVVQDINLREAGKNRHPIIDEFNKWAGVAVGSPYCLSGALYRLDETCNILGLKNPVGRCAGTQSFYDLAPAKYKNTFDRLVLPGDIGIMQVVLDQTRGHAFIVAEKKEPGVKKVKTYEYNTGSSGERDGEGFFEKTRTDDITTMRVRGFVDVLTWILDSQEE